MAETIISKRCSKCKEIKPITEFYKNRSTKDGCHSWCKSCDEIWQKQYRQSGHRERKRVYQASNKGRATRKKYRKEYRKKYRQTEKGKLAQIRTGKRHRLRWPKRRKARKAITNAIATGKIPPASSLQCSCGNPAKEYHHHKGYEPEHQLDVIPVCKKCHKKCNP